MEKIFFLKTITLSFFLLNISFSLFSATIIEERKFILDSSTASKSSSWLTPGGKIDDALGFRRFGFWGRILNPCLSSDGSESKLSGSNKSFNKDGVIVRFPHCDFNTANNPKGPSFEKEVVENGVLQHVIRTHIGKSGSDTNSFMTSFDSSGQDGRGTNAYIHAGYAGYSFRLSTIKMKPWSGRTGIGAFRSKQRVRQFTLTQPLYQSLQQNARFVVVNKSCLSEVPQKVCRVEFQMKAFLKGKSVPSNPAIQETRIGFDPVQGGSPYLGMNFNTTGKPVKYEDAILGISWGQPTQNRVGFSNNQWFQIHISWDQFQTILVKIVEKGLRKYPSLSLSRSSLFGNKFAVKSEWYLWNAGYGQENMNEKADEAGTLIEGSFERIEVLAL